MRKFKKMLSLILSVVTIGSCVAGMVFTTSAANETEYSENISSGNGGTYHGGYYVSYTDDDTMSYRTCINYSFTAFSFGVYTNGNAGQYYTYSIYEWDTSFEQTMANGPIVFEKIENSLLKLGIGNSD